MNDDEFLGYCLSMADTPRCGFVKDQMHRLNMLAGMWPEARVWLEQPRNYVFDVNPDTIRKLVEQAKEMRP